MPCRSDCACAKSPVESSNMPRAGNTESSHQPTEDKPSFAQGCRFQVGVDAWPVLILIVRLAIREAHSKAADLENPPAEGPRHG